MTDALNQVVQLRSVVAELTRDLPLRRLVWKVIQPTESFTVSDVTARLRSMGAEWPPHKVSNALSYWVTRGRLERRSQGVYRWPVEGGVS